MKERQRSQKRIFRCERCRRSRLDQVVFAFTGLPVPPPSTSSYCLEHKLRTLQIMMVSKLHPSLPFLVWTRSPTKLPGPPSSPARITIRCSTCWRWCYT
jgi:hypothetical protein